MGDESAALRPDLTIMAMVPRAFEQNAARLRDLVAANPAEAGRIEGRSAP
ncbi:MAG: hypothetical protein ACH36H_06280 [Candidatus Nanopelagicales bacterium]